jgi:hypothetical protein
MQRLAAQLQQMLRISIGYPRISLHRTAKPVNTVVLLLLLLLLLLV